MPDVGALVRPSSAAQDADIFARCDQMIDNDAAYGSRAAGYE
jgi:hypothetical protein